MRIPILVICTTLCVDAQPNLVAHLMKTFSHLEEHISNSFPGGTLTENQHGAHMTNEHKELIQAAIQNMLTKLADKLFHPTDDDTETRIRRDIQDELRESQRTAKDIINYTFRFQRDDLENLFNATITRLENIGEKMATDGKTDNILSQVTKTIEMFNTYADNISSSISSGVKKRSVVPPAQDSENKRTLSNMFENIQSSLRGLLIEETTILKETVTEFGHEILDMYAEGVAKTLKNHNEIDHLKSKSNLNVPAGKDNKKLGQESILVGR